MRKVTRRRLLVAFLAVAIVGWWAGADVYMATCAQPSLLKGVFRPHVPDSRADRTALKRWFRAMTDTSVADVMFCEEGGWLDHPAWMQFSTKHPEIVDTFFKDFRAFPFGEDTLPSIEIMAPRPPWFDAPTEPSNVRYLRGSARHHLWLTLDGKHVWFHYFDH